MRKGHVRLHIAAIALLGGVLFSSPITAQTFTPPSDAPDGGQGTVGILEVFNNGGIGSLTDALTSISGGTGIRLTGSNTIINYSDGVDAFFPGGVPFLTTTHAGGPMVPQGNINNMSVLYRGYIHVPSAGDYTFNPNSDDGFLLAFTNTANNQIVPFTSTTGNGSVLTTFNTVPNGAATAGNRGVGHTFAQINFPTAGVYSFNFAYFEGGGDASVELSAAAGAKTTNDGTFFLVGDAPQPAVNGQNKVGTLSQWTLEEYTGVGSVGEVLLSHGGFSFGTLRGISNVPTIRFHDPQNSNTGSHGADAVPFPNDTPASDDNNYGAFATSTLTIAAADAGRYTFAMYTDDDSRFRILNGSTPVPLVGMTFSDEFDSNLDGVNDEFGTNGCCFDQIGHYDLAAGTYTIEAAFHEGGEGSGFFIYGTQGERNFFDAAAFQLLGSNQDLGPWTVPATTPLQLVPEPSSVTTFFLLTLAAAACRLRRGRAA